MQEESFSLDDFRELFKKGFASERSQYREQRFSGLDREQLLWTALAPSWTVELAQKSEFPAGDVAAYLEDLHRRSLVRKSLVRGDEDEIPPLPVYTMDDVTRSDILETLADNRDEIEALDPMIAAIGGRVLNAIDQRILSPPFFAPPGIARWALLAARASQPDGIARTFDVQVEQAFQKRASITIRDWINSGQSFSAHLIKRGDDSMKQALLRASQRLVLLQREENDQRHLKYFYQRDEQLHAFEELMNSDDSCWALHFLGAGGVGKTMLVRKITVDWARDHDAIAARIDFDYLKADYPTLDPGMLLWAFAQDLRAHANSAAIRLFNQADRRLADLSKRIRAELSDGVRKRATDYPEFSDALSAYTDALRLMPKRVLLIVDTCEELAKIGIGRTPVENIDETFRILRALHDGAHTLRDESAPPAGGVPNLRVIFSGRRPLSQEGLNWRCPDASQLKPRSFLRLHEVRGFRQTDAVQFLENKMHVAKSLVPAIVTRSSPDTGSVAEIEWDDPTNNPTQETRCNPYDLKLYGDWAREEPPPTAQEILATPPATQYVELRVLRRLHYEPLRDILPAVGLLGHFDRHALHKIFSPKMDAETIDTVFDVLQQEEWINQHLVQDSEGEANLILDVEAGLRARLFVYFRKSPLLAEFQPRAAEYFQKLTLEGDLSKLDWSTFDAALTVLESCPDQTELIHWWEQIDARMFSLQPPEWIRNVTKGMQNEGGAAAWRDPQAPPDAPPESRLRTAVLATHASALLRAARPAEIKLIWRDLKGIWQEILDKTAGLLDASPQLLQIRAIAGMVAVSLLGDESEIDWKQLKRFWGFVVFQAVKTTPFFGSRQLDDPQLAASLVAAAESIVEYAEKIAQTDPSGLQDLLTGQVESLVGLNDSPSAKDRVSLFTLLLTILPETADDSSPSLKSLKSFALCLAARAETLLGNFDEAKRLFLDSIALVDFAPDGAMAHSPWFDWCPPEDVAARVVLEFIRAAYPAFMSPREILDLVYSRAPQTAQIDRQPIDEGLPLPPPEHYPPLRLHLIDNERMHSALLQLKFADGPVPSNELLAFTDQLAPTGTPLYFPAQPGAVAPGRVDVEPEVLRCRAHHVTSPLFVTVGEILASNGWSDIVLKDLATVVGSNVKMSYETLLAIDRSCSRIISRLRLRDVGEKGGQTLISSGDIGDKKLAWTLDGQDGSKNENVIPQLPPELRDLKIEPPSPLALQLAARSTEWSVSLSAPERDKLRWLHAIWQTQFGSERPSATVLMNWARENFAWYEESAFARFSGHELANIELDIIESHALAVQYGRELKVNSVRRRQNTELPARIGPQPAAEFALWLRALALDVTGDRPRNAWNHPAVSRLGRRRAAEIALGEADLLSLRLPERAAALYQLAVVLFLKCNDHVSAFLAGTSEAMTVSLPDAKRLAGVLKTSYEEGRLSDSEFQRLPTTETLEAWVEQKALPKDWQERSWRPRLVRYMLLLAMVTYREKRQTVGAQIIKAGLPVSISSGPDGTEFIPADLTTWLSRAFAPPGIFRSIKDFFREALPLVAALGLLVGIVAIGFLVFRWLFSRVAVDFVERSSGWNQFATFVMVTLAVALLIRLLLKVRRRNKQLETSQEATTSEAVATEAESTKAPEATDKEYPTWRIWLHSGIIWALVAVIAWLHFWDVITRFSWQRLTLVIAFAILGSLLFVFRDRLSRLGTWLEHMAATVFSFWFTRLVKQQLTVEVLSGTSHTGRLSTEMPYLEVTLQRSLFRFKFLNRWFRGTLYSYRGLQNKSGLQAYEKLSDELSQAGFFDSFHEVRRSLRTFSLAVEITIPEGAVNGLCWEALIPNELENGARENSYLPFHCYRTLSVTATRTPIRAERINVCAFAGSEIGHHLANEGWRTLASTPKFALELGSPEKMIGSINPQVSIVHLVGTVESSYLGLGFLLGEEHSIATQSSSPTGGEGIIRSEDLTRSFPNASVCIVQEEPRIMSSQRLEGDRRDAFFARVFASQLYAKGLPLVIVIPPLRINDAVKAIGTLAGLLFHGSQLKPAMLLRAIADWQLQTTDYAASVGIEPAAARELTLDFCLYLNRDWDGRLR